MCANTHTSEVIHVSIMHALIGDTVASNQTLTSSPLSPLHFSAIIPQLKMTTGECYLCGFE